MRASNGCRHKTQRRSIAENKRRLATLMNDLRCGRKDVLRFLRGVGHVLGKCNTNDNDDDGDETEQAETEEEEDEEEPTTNNESAGNSQVNVSICSLNLFSISSLHL